MNYGSYRYPVVYQAAQPKPSRKKWYLAACICIALCLVIAAIAIGLGVGLGVGLGSSSDSSSKSTSVLSAPSVTCTYAGSNTCGCAAITPSFVSSRIINGYSAVANSWPWTVLLTVNNVQRCDGFLIGYQHVITAAHCVSGITVSTLQVFAGLHSLSSSSSTRQSRTVSAVKVHDSYDSSAYTNDIAVLKLSSSFTATNYVGLCCLTSDTSLPSTGEHAVIVGWGTTSSSSTTIPDTLQQAVVEVKSASSCGTSSTSSIQFCAGYSNTDACQGDSGGPLMTAVNNSWTCTGIVSSGRGCGSGGYYTRVSAYRSFINTYVASL